MSQAGFTPIQLYFSTTAAATPSAGNLANGELAINITDGKLYYKDNGGVVKLLASNAGSAGDVVGPGSSTDNALVRFDSTTGKLVQNSVGILSDAGVLTGLTGLTSSGTITLSSLTSGRVVYTTTGGALTDSANLLYSGTDLTVYGLTVGRGASGLANNTAVGASALAAVTSGNSNTAMGQGSLSGNTTGASNAGFGQATLNANTTGNYNTAVGGSTLPRNTTGSANTAVGTSALEFNTTASNNTAVGYQAGYSNTTGAGNTAVGYQSVYFNTTGTQLVAHGFQALHSNTTGNNNVAVGHRALFLNTTGGENIAMGFGSLDANTTATGNTALGHDTLGANTTGASNVAVGYHALLSNTTAPGNTAVGYQAGYSNTTGQNNVVVGFQALLNSTTASNLTAVGWSALKANTTGPENSAFGLNALFSNTTGGQNVAVGQQALQANTTASNNTAVGFQAGFSNTTGVNSVYLGIGAGRSVTTASDNCMAGYYAGESTTGGGNTFFGKLAGNAVTSGTKNTIIGSYNGNQGGLDIRTASNYIVLSDGDGNPRLWNNATATYSAQGLQFVASAGGESNGFASIRVADNQSVSTDARLMIGNANGAYANLRLISNSTSVLALDSVVGSTSASIDMLLNVNGGKIGMGLGSINASGGVLQLASGITFPATQSASTDANTLDDYEEGTWSPTITNAASYSTQVGRYVKIGKLVYINADIVCSYTNTGSTTVRIGGLPFVIENVTAMYPVGTIFPVQGFNQSTLNISTQGDVNASSVTLYTSTPSTGVNYAFVVPSTFGTVVEFEFSMVYRAAD
jgi:hypothetical protein